MPELDAISQLGLVLFMFIVGAELRLPAGAKAQIVAAAWIGVSSVLLPMALGFAAAVPLHPLLAPEAIAARPPVIGRIADDAFLLDVRAVDDASAFAVSFPDTRS